MLYSGLRLPVQYGERSLAETASDLYEDDAHLTPALKAWIATTFRVERHAVRDLQSPDPNGSQISQVARAAEADAMTKDKEMIS
jgi:hypothetical protein